MQAIPIPCEDHAEWLENRKKGLGGSDIAAVAGLSPFAGPIDVWQDKLGLTITVESEPMAWGSALEQPIADRYAKNHPNVQLSEPGLVRSPKEDWMLATPDRLVGDAVVAVRGLELKTAGSYMADRWGDPPDGEIPDEYYAQIQWYMRVTGLMEWDVAVLIAGQDYREYRIDVNQPYADELVMTGAKFWYDNVLKNEVPPMDATEGAKKYLEERFPIENVSKGMLSAGEDAEGLFYSLLLARENETTATTQKKELENKLKALIGDYEGITFDRNGKILWKRARDREKIDWRGTAQDLEPDSQKLGHITHEHTETVQGSRTFRVTPPKE